MPEQHSEHRKGVLFAIAAFTMWGTIPIYFKAVDQVPALEVLAHRVIWSCVFLFAFISLTGRFQAMLDYLKRPKLMAGLALSAAVIAVNWLVFIWAVAEERIVETTLGYFINPLINIVFGMLFFQEQLRPFQWVSVALACCAVIFQIVLLGELPWVALVLALSFALYSVLRKQIPIDSISGLFVETLWLLPLACGYMLWLHFTSGFMFMSGDTTITLLLLAAGIITSLPLLAFASGARRLSLTMIGLLQYIGPSIAFSLAVFYYGEPMEIEKLFTFILIWIGLAIFSIEGIIHQRRKHSHS